MRLRLADFKHRNFQMRSNTWTEEQELWWHPTDLATGLHFSTSSGRGKELHLIQWASQPRKISISDKKTNLCSGLASIVLQHQIQQLFFSYLQFNLLFRSSVTAADAKCDQ